MFYTSKILFKFIYKIKLCMNEISLVSYKISNLTIITILIGYIYIYNIHT